MLLVAAVLWLVFFPEPHPPQVPEMEWGEIPWWKNFGDPPLEWSPVKTKVLFPWWTTALMVGLYLFAIWICFYLWGLRMKMENLRKGVVSDMVAMNVAETRAKQESYGGQGTDTQS